MVPAKTQRVSGAANAIVEGHLIMQFDSADQKLLLAGLGVVLLILFSADATILFLWFRYEFWRYRSEVRANGNRTITREQAEWERTSKIQTTEFRSEQSDASAASELVAESEQANTISDSPEDALIAFDSSLLEFDLPSTSPTPVAAEASAPRSDSADGPPVDHVEVQPVPVFVSIPFAHDLKPPFASTWSLVHPFVGFQFVMAVVIFLSIAFMIPGIVNAPGVGGAAAAATSNANASMLITIGGLFAQNIGFVGIVAYFLRRYGSSLAEVGLGRPKLRDIGKGAVFGVGLMLMSFLLERLLDTTTRHILSKHFMDHMSKLSDSLSAGGMFDDIKDGRLKLLFALGGSIAVPIGEEVFFRGLLYNGLKRRWGIRAGIVISAVCFALIHVAPISVIIIIPMGIALAYAYEKTGSLWVTITMHAVNNGASFAISALLVAKSGH